MQPQGHWSGWWAIVAGAAILLSPALAAGRPFVHWDTPTFYAWGHDIVAALEQPWPPLSDFPAHRGLRVADFPGNPDRITPEQFQVSLTQMGARSEFYAVPVYLLSSAFTLWAPAVLQCLLAAWVLWTAFITILSPGRPTGFLAVVAMLALGTTAGIFSTFLMPDLFAPLGVLSAALILFYADRLSARQRFLCASTVAIAVAVHTSHGMILAAEVLIAMTVARLFPTGTRVAQGAGIVGLAIVFALGAGAASRAGLHAIFGQEIRNVPFLVGRLIVDGPGQWYLREVCAQRNYVACRFKDTKVTDPAEFIWVGQASPLYVNDPEERRRFLDEQWAFVRGTITRFPLGQSRASLANVVMQLRFLDIETHTGTSLPGLLHEDSYRTQTVLEIVPHIAPCLGSDSNRCSYDSLVHPVQRMVRYTIALAAVAALAFRLGRWLPSGQR